MIQIRKQSFHSIKDEWSSIYNHNDMISPYMSYEFQCLYKKYLWMGSKRIGFHYVCYCAYSDGRLICIIPCIVKKKSAYIAGDLCATGALDFLYKKDITEEELSEILYLLSKMVRGELNLNKVDEQTILGRVMKRNNSVTSKCVGIVIPDSYEKYNKSLSKSVRQNIRTAHNRLKREEKKYEFSTYWKNELTKKDQIEILQLYNKRTSEREGTTVGVIESFIREKYNPITLAWKKLDNSFTSIIRIDGIIVAFLNGFVNNTGSTVIIPRLAIDSDFGVYCPGSLLIDDTIRYLIENTAIRFFDLSRGDEKYKFAMGGTIHNNLSAIIRNIE